MNNDVYSQITNTIIADLKHGQLTWQKPWSVKNSSGLTIRPLRHNGVPYSGINVLMLWSAATKKGYGSPFWMTFKQAKQLGAHVRKGERGSPVVYANTVTKPEQAEEHTDQKHSFGFIKSYSVFNCDQIEGLEDDYYASADTNINSNERITHAERFVDATGATIFHGGNRACYCIATDHIQMPYFGAFHTPQTYYATLAHELVHWTKHRSRLDRDFGRSQQDDRAYATEELVAELGAAFLCADLGLSPHRNINHAAYIQAWLKILKNDKRAIFTAAAHADRAARYLHDSARMD